MTEIPASGDPVEIDPLRLGLVLVVTTGTTDNPVQLLACAECGVLVWDAFRHWRDAHANRLAALRAIAARKS